MCGKTAIAEGLASKIARDEVPQMLRNKRIINLDISSMVAGSKYTKKEYFEAETSKKQDVKMDF